MDKRIEEWEERRAKIPPAKYLLKCFEARKVGVWHQGGKGWGKSEKITLWFEVFSGEHAGKVVPMYLPLKLDKGGNATGKIPQGSFYYQFWVIANGLKPPVRGRLDEMPMRKFEKKLFQGRVVTVKPKWPTGEEKPEIFHYSRVDILYSFEGDVVEEIVEHT